MNRHNRLTTRIVREAQPITRDGKLFRASLGDGGGLYLIVDTNGSKRWLFRYQISGRRRDMGLGGLDKVDLATARAKRDAAKSLLGRGLDPLSGTSYGGPASLASEKVSCESVECRPEASTPANIEHLLSVGEVGAVLAVWVEIPAQDRPRALAILRALVS